MKSKVVVKVQKRDYIGEVKRTVDLLKDSDGTTDFKIVRDMQWHPTISFDMDEDNELVKLAVDALIMTDDVEVYTEE